MKRSRATFDAENEAELRAAAERSRAEAAAAAERTRLQTELESLQVALFNNIVLLCGVLSRDDVRIPISARNSVNAPPNLFGLMHQQSLGIARLKGLIMSGDVGMLYS